MAEALLDIRGLNTYFLTFRGVARAVDGVDLTVARGEILGLVGESGCGKSVTAHSIMGLIREPGRVVAGRILLGGQNLLTMNEGQLARIRGARVSMGFQNPLTSLNPVFTIGEQVSHVIRLHQRVRRRQALERTLEVFAQVRLPDPAQLLRKYPHELSGGQLQRVIIAMALSCKPELLIADEPTTALDVTIQAQILALMLRLREETGAALLLITHDLGVVSETCDRVAVMYAGKIVEQAPAAELFANPVHPYTELLLASVPDPDRRGRDLKTIPGTVPSLIDPPAGCLFHPRCPLAREICRTELPDFTPRSQDHLAACHLR